MNRAKALLESGQVQRLHAIPHHKSYSVAEHSWNMAVLLYELHNNPSPRLVWAVLLHDAPERWTGDVPAPAKWLHPDLEKSLDSIEKQYRKLLEVDFQLDKKELDWLSALDLLELHQYCNEEINMGNTNMDTIMATCWKILTEKEWVPLEVKKWLLEESWQPRVSDYLGMEKEIGTD